MYASDQPLTLHAALYRIAEETVSGSDLPTFYAAMHSIVAQLMFAANFYIALHDAQTNTLSFPYFVDENDPPPPPRPMVKGLTEYVLRTGQSHLVTPAVFRKLQEQGEVELVLTPAVDWLGVPLKVDDHVLGVLVVQSYHDAIHFSETDKELLTFVSRQIAIALTRKRTEAALRESEEKYRSLFEQAPIGIYRTSPNGRILDANPALIHMLGYDSFAQMALRDLETEGFAPPYSRTEFKRLLQQTGILRGHEAIWQRRDGSSLIICENAHAIYGADGDVLYYEGTVEDISEQKQAQERLHILQRAIEQSPAAIMLSDTQGNVEYVNPKFTQATGYQPEEVIGRNPRLLKSGETAPAEYARLWQTISSGGEWRGEFHNRKKNGELFWEAASISAITDPTGRITHYLAVKEDITARKTMEAAERQQHALVEMLRHIAALINSTLDLNEVLDRILGNIGRVVPHDAAIIMLIEGDLARIVRSAGYADMGLTDEALQFPFVVSATRNLHTMLTSNRPLVIPDVTAYPGWIVTQAGHQTRAFVGAPIRCRRGIIGFLSLESREPGFFNTTHAERLQALADQTGIAIDNAQLYERVRAHAVELEARVAGRTVELQAANAKLQELDHLKSQFVANVSHELRTPLANIKLYLQLLEKGRADKHTQYLATLNREASLLHRLIEELLDLSRFDLGQRSVALTPLDVNLLIQRLLSDRAALIADRGLTLQTRLTPDLPTIPADQAMMTQVLTNLLTNAMNYTPTGGVITLATQLRSNSEHDWLTFSVSDTGPGISPRDRMHIFDRFYRGDASRTAAASGTGLGLAICQEILRRHDGQITLESEPGHGSTFTAWLPLSLSRPHEV